MKRASLLQLGVGEKQGGLRSRSQFTTQNPRTPPQKPPFLHPIRSAPGQLAANKEI